MEFVFAIPILLLPMVIPFITGVIADSYGRKFWPWFILGIFLPFIACFILLCLPDGPNKKKRVWKVTEEQGADQYFIYGDKQTINGHESDLSATA